MSKKRFFLFFILLVCFLGFLFAIPGFAQKTIPADQDLNPEDPARIEEKVASPQNIKETTGIYVFLAWMWISIVILLYIVRQKVKEEDRLHHLKFFSDEKMNNLL